MTNKQTLDLIAEVVRDDRNLRCPECRVNVDPDFSRSGQHIKATCPECERYLKFARQIAFLGDRIDYKTIPNPRSVDTVKRYVEHGINPGHFLTLLFANSLMSYKYADPTNKSLFEAWIDWKNSEIPGDIAGSMENVKQHMSRGGLHASK